VPVFNQVPRHEDVLGEWRYAFLTSGLDGGEWSASPACRFAPEKEPRVPIRQEARWAPEPVWTWWRKKIPAPAGNRATVAEPVA
jgi:hypothetical protein